MPLPPGTFGGEDLTSMEFRIFEQMMKKKANKKSAWNSSNVVASKDDPEKEDEKAEDVPESAASTVVGSTPVEISEDEGIDDEPFVDAMEDLETHGESNNKQLRVPTHQFPELPSSQISELPSQKEHEVVKHDHNMFTDIMFLPDFEILPKYEREEAPSESEKTPRKAPLNLDRASSPSSPSTSSPSSPVSPRYMRCPERSPRGGPPRMASRSPPPRPTLHEGFVCRGCAGPIFGSIFKCMSRCVVF